MHLTYTQMKPTTVALLILMNMMCTIGYIDHASFLGTKAQETTLLAIRTEAMKEPVLRRA